MDSISGDSHVIPPSFPRSKSCVDSIYEAHSAEVRYRIISKRWACVIGNCMHQVWDDFGSGWVIFSKNGSFRFRDSTVFHIHSNVSSVLCNRTTPKFRRIDCDCRPRRCSNIEDICATGFDCISPGCSGLDSVVFHCNIKDKWFPSKRLLCKDSHLH